MDLYWLTGTVTHSISSYLLSSCSLDIPFFQNSISMIASTSTLLIASHYKAQIINSVVKTDTSSASPIPSVYASICKYFKQLPVSKMYSHYFCRNEQMLFAGLHIILDSAHHSQASLESVMSTDDGTQISLSLL